MAIGDLYLRLNPVDETGAAWMLLPQLAAHYALLGTLPTAECVLLMRLDKI